MSNMSKLTVNQACDLISVSRPTLYKYINTGRISAIKEGKNTYIDTSEFLRVFPNAKLKNSKDTVEQLHELTTDLTHKDELINMLKKQIDDKQKDNEFLKEQLTQANANFSQLNKLLEDKTATEKPTKRRKVFGIF